MEKKKLKLSISGSSKKTINSIEQAKSQSKNTLSSGSTKTKSVPCTISETGWPFRSLELMAITDVRVNPLFNFFKAVS